MSQVLLPEQVADLLQITVEAVHDLRLKGLLKCIRIGHRTIRFTEKQVADYLAKISQ
jgi:predicted site-specific integrase-resolvase